MFLPITDFDVPSIVALMNRAYRGSGSSADWSTEAAYVTGDRTSDELLRADLIVKPGASLLKWVYPPDDELLGCVWLEPSGNGTWYLGLWRRTLIGRIPVLVGRCFPQLNSGCASGAEHLSV